MKNSDILFKKTLNTLLVMRSEKNVTEGEILKLDKQIMELKYNHKKGKI